MEQFWIGRGMSEFFIINAWCLCVFYFIGNGFILKRRRALTVGGFQKETRHDNLCFYDSTYVEIVLSRGIFMT